VETFADFIWRNTARVVDGVGRRTVGRGFADLMAFGCSIVHGFANSDSVSLTFDDSPSPHSTAAIVDRLARYNVPATFFCIGDNVARYPELARLIASSGHELGNHSMTHADLYRVGPQRLRREVAACQSVLQATCGVPVSLFRAPYGRFRGDLGLAAATGIRNLVKWDIAPAWFESDAAFLANEILERARPGSIILLHDGLANVDESHARAVGEATAECVTIVVPELLSRGLKFKTIGQQLAEFTPRYRPLVN
jgi:peptidoglycan/xylan/chitin deacetylase (PgdA/CDA1 family)